MELVNEFKTSDFKILGDNTLSDGGTTAVSQKMFDLVHAVTENATAANVKALQDFAQEGTNTLSLTAPTQSQVYAVGDAFRNEETGKLIEGRGEIAVDMNGDGIKETRVTARLSEDGKTSLVVSNDSQKIIMNNSVLARDIIGDIADARANGSYSDPEKDKLINLARSAVQFAGLDNLAGSMQVAQADRGTLGDVGTQSVGNNVQQGPATGIGM
jgi:ABC-type antimicrobial peptide transport system permease subunit